jgi:hypothetical protein
VENLDKNELGKLLLAIKLDDGLGHKVGLGKAIGLGSCRIKVDQQKSLIWQPEGRYADWSRKVTVDLSSFKKADRSLLSGELVEVLRLNKPEDDGDIGYPPYNQYPRDTIDARGVFGGSTVKGGRPSSWPAEDASTPLAASVPGGAAESKDVSVLPPQEPLPIVKQDEEAAWLKEICGDWLIFVSTQGKEIGRKRSGYQGKPALLEVGKWFILSGTNTSRRAL